MRPPGRLEFWPRVLLSPVDVERVRSTGFRLYNGRDARTYAINWGQEARLLLARLRSTDLLHSAPPA